jgi:hypothetical protein
MQEALRQKLVLNLVERAVCNGVRGRCVMVYVTVYARGVEAEASVEVSGESGV